jgi:hypothetical protein
MMNNYSMHIIEPNFDLNHFLMVLAVAIVEIL